MSGDREQQDEENKGQSNRSLSYNEQKNHEKDKEKEKVNYDKEQGQRSFCPEEDFLFLQKLRGEFFL